MERPDDAYLLNEQRVATRMPDFGVDEKENQGKNQNLLKRKRRLHVIKD